MKLLAGLGNPGSRYAQTRHNVGFHVIARIAQRYGATSPKAKFEGELADVAISGQRVLLLCPTTYMNNSGRSVQAAAAFYQIEPSDVLVICDDFSLPLGKLRFRAKGSSGGQKGLQDIIRRLGTDQIPRLRIGIGPVPDRIDPADFVLGKFLQEQQPVIEATLDRAVQGAVDWVEQGVEFCMNRYNADPGSGASS